MFVCVDGSPESEAVLSVVARLSSRPGATIWLLNVATPVSRAEAVLLAETLHSNYLRRVVDRWRERGVRLNWEVLHGPDPARAILEHVGDRGLIVLTSHGASGREGGLGPVAAGVLAHASAPVIVLHA